MSSNTLGYSLIRMFRLDGAFSKILELEANPVEVQQLQQKDKGRQNRNVDFCACPSKNVVKRVASGVRKARCCVANAI